jgi:hypothetical protein
LHWKLDQHGHHRNVQEGNNHSKTEPKVEQRLCPIVSHLIEKPTDHEPEEDVHVNSYHQISLQGKLSFMKVLKLVTRIFYLIPIHLFAETPQENLKLCEARTFEFQILRIDFFLEGGESFRVISFFAVVVHFCVSIFYLLRWLPINYSPVVNHFNHPM